MDSAELKNYHRAISEACYAGDTSGVEALLGQGGDMAQLWSIPDYPLAIAASQNNVELMRLLLDSGMPLYMNTQREQRQTKVVADCTLAGTWSSRCHEGVMYLIAEGAKLHSTVFSYMPITRLACMSEYDAGEQSDKFFHLIEQAGIDIDVPIIDGDLLLHFIAKCNNRYVAEFIKYSKDLNVTNSVGQRALTIAVTQAAHFAVHSLLEAGADPHYVVDDEGGTLLDRANWALTYRADRNFLGEVDGIIASLKKAGL
jgi:ankyrin repeat protein